MIALGMLALVHGWHGDEAAALAAADRANAVAERRNVPLPAIYARYAFGLLAGTPDEAVERLEAVRAEALPGNVLWAPHLADAYLRAGRRDDAEALVEHYARTIEHHRIAPAILERLRGMTRQDESHFVAALALHDAGPAPFELARTQLAYGAYLRADGRRDEAREPLREALAAFERIEALPFAERARRELRAAGAVTRAAAEATCRANRARAAGRAARRPGPDQPRDGGGPVRERQDRRAPPAQRVPQARHQAPRRARSAGRR